MAYKIFLRYSMLLILLFFCFTTMYAQNNQENQARDASGNIIQESQEPTDYQVVETNRGVMFIQTLTWDSGGNAYKYGLVMQRLSNAGSWQYFNVANSVTPGENTNAQAEQWVNEGVTYNGLTTTTNSIQVSLSAGTYRYRVHVFNFLDRVESESEWFQVEVFRAIQPRAFSFTPGTLYLDEVQTGLFDFNISNVTERSTLILRIPGSPSRTAYGTIANRSGNRGQIQFNMNHLDVGVYEFVVENPGGLTSVVEPITIKFLKPYDFNVSGGYSLMYIIPSDLTNYFENELAPLGANIRVTYIPLKRNFGNIGFELTAYAFLYGADFTSYDISTNIIPATLNFVYQYPLIKKRLILDTHVGGGITYFNNLTFLFSSSVESPSLHALSYTGSAGVSFQVYLSTRLFLEVGTDYTISPLNDFFFQTITPYLNIAYQF